jgi:hypothetical protein
MRTACRCPHCTPLPPGTLTPALVADLAALDLLCYEWSTCEVPSCGVLLHAAAGVAMRAGEHLRTCLHGGTQRLSGVIELSRASVDADRWMLAMQRSCRLPAWCLAQAWCIYSSSLALECVAETPLRAKSTLVLPYAMLSAALVISAHASRLVCCNIATGYKLAPDSRHTSACDVLSRDVKSRVSRAARWTVQRLLPHRYTFSPLPRRWRAAFDIGTADVDDARAFRPRTARA